MFKPQLQKVTQILLKYGPDKVLLKVILCLDPCLALCFSSHALVQAIHKVKQIGHQNQTRDQIQNAVVPWCTCLPIN